MLTLGKLALLGVASRLLTRQAFDSQVSQMPGFCLDSIARLLTRLARHVDSLSIMGAIHSGQRFKPGKTEAGSQCSIASVRAGSLKLHREQSIGSSTRKR